ncbi:hypothetical protein PGT21_011312 [Puccinia graminis f. sp. tritici]|uniref:Uncharacterized protein n=1 Tax=Puccinia graminis f. sp. tritici TaxID=56615 RepID=A0A5B0NZI3_PUCGR|nr:hypothetical protein PGT21_011312 [Puccinia graminis f. sp. tritici]
MRMKCGNRPGFKPEGDSFYSVPKCHQRWANSTVAYHTGPSLESEDGWASTSTLVTKPNRMVGQTSSPRLSNRLGGPVVYELTKPPASFYDQGNGC